MPSEPVTKELYKFKHKLKGVIIQDKKIPNWGYIADVIEKTLEDYLKPEVKK